MDPAIADPQFGTGGFFLRHYEFFSQDNLELQVNPPMTMASAPPFFLCKKKPIRNLKGLPKVMRKRGINMAVDSHKKVISRPTSLLPNQPLFGQKKWVGDPKGCSW